MKQGASLVKILEAQIQESDSAASEVGDQRERNHANYSMLPMGNEQPGRSQYISPDVLDSVEAKKALFAETFFSGRQVVKFVASGGTTQAEADIKTAYVNACLAHNIAFELLRDGWHDAFVAKRMVMFARWDQKTEDVSVTIEGALLPQAMQLVQQSAGSERVVDIDEAKVQQVGAAPDGTPVLSGTIVAKVDKSYVCLALVQPERFFRDPRATYVSTSTFCAYAEEVTRGQLVEQGYDPAQVITLKADYRFGASSEDSARKAHDGSSSAGRSSNRAREQETVTIYRTYTWLDEQTVAGALQGQRQSRQEMSSDGVQLYEIIWGHGEVLNRADGQPAITVVDEMPFFEWTEYKVSHAEHGMSDADVLAHTQRVNSTLKRLILDNQQMRNSSRYEAVHGAVKNPRDLIDNRIGGVVWSSRIGSVAPLATPELSPLTMGVLQMLKQDSEARSGVSDLSKGMNTDAIKYQNSADMIERLTNASNRRSMKAARDFAETLLVPLCKYIVKLGKKHDQRLHQLNVRGEIAPTTPATEWTDYESDCRVTVALTPQQGQQQAQSLLMLHQVLSQDPDLQMLYGLPQKYALLDEVFDGLGMSDSTRYLMRPDSPQVQQASQQRMQVGQKQMQDQQQLIELDKAEKQIRIQSMATDEQRKNAMLELERSKFQLDAADKATDNARENEKLKWQKLTDTAEYAMENSQNRAVKIGEKL